MHRWMIDSWVGDWMDGERWGDGEMDGWGGGEKGCSSDEFPLDPGNESQRDCMEPGSPSSGCSRGCDLLRLRLKPKAGGLGDQTLGPAGTYIEVDFLPFRDLRSSESEEERVAYENGEWVPTRRLVLLSNI